MSGSDTKAGGEAGRISIRVSPEVKKALEEIQLLGKLNSIADAVRRAIGDELFLQEQMAQGWQVVLRKDNKFREVVWPKF
jgi:hypothetical protein